VELLTGESQQYYSKYPPPHKEGPTATGLLLLSIASRWSRPALGRAHPPDEYRELFRGKGPGV
jgi:hypothetical protein